MVPGRPSACSTAERAARAAGAARVGQERQLGDPSACFSFRYLASAGVSGRLTSNQRGRPTVGRRPSPGRGTRIPYASAASTPAASPRGTAIGLADYFRILERFSLALQDEGCGLTARPLMLGATDLVLSNLAGCGSLPDVMRHRSARRRQYRHSAAAAVLLGSYTPGMAAARVERGTSVIDRGEDCP